METTGTGYCGDAGQNHPETLWGEIFWLVWYFLHWQSDADLLDGTYMIYWEGRFTVQKSAVGTLWHGDTVSKRPLTLIWHLLLLITYMYTIPLYQSQASRLLAPATYQPYKYEIAVDLLNNNIKISNRVTMRWMSLGVRCSRRLKEGSQSKWGKDFTQLFLYRPCRVSVCVSVVLLGPSVEVFLVTSVVDSDNI